MVRMIAALTPLASWAVFLVCVAVGVVVYVVVAGRRRWRDMVESVDFMNPRMAPVDRFRPELDAPVRIFGGIYDHETRGDFRWSLDHDPTIDHDRCEVCNARLRRAFNRLADYDLGPRDADMLMAAIRRELES